MIWIKKTSHTIFILLGLSLCLSKAYANTPSWGTDQFGLSVGLKYQNRLSKRGLITYDSWQLLPVVSADLFCNCLFLVGKSIHYKQQLTPWLRLRSKLALDATGDTPLVETGDTPATPKKTSNEISFGAEWTWQERGEFGANFNKDVSSHYGSYIGGLLKTGDLSNSYDTVRDSTGDIPCNRVGVTLT